MHSRDILARLAAEGWSKVHQAGSHQKWKKGGRSVTVPHPRKDIPLGTLRNIFKQAGWDWQER